MNRTAQFALAVVLAFASTLGYAGTALLEWELPTALEDGSPLALEEISGTRIEYGRCTASGSFGAKLGEFLVAGSASSATTPDLPPGTYCFRGFAQAGGLEAAASDVLQLEVPAVVLAAVPGLNMAPLFGINANGSRGSVVLGFVPVGARCAGPVVYRYRSRDYRRIADSTVVAWWATAATSNAAAPCG